MTTTSRDTFFTELTELVDRMFDKCLITPEEVVGVLTLKSMAIAMTSIDIIIEEDLEGDHDPEEDDEEEEYPPEFPGPWKDQEPEA